MGSYGTLPTINDEKKSEKKSDTSDDILLAMILGSLIYTLDRIRQISRTHHKFVTEFGKDQAMRDLLEGTLDYINVNPDKQNLDELNPEDLDEILENQLFGNTRYKLNSDFTKRNIKQLMDLKKNGTQRLFINNFNAVNNDEEAVYAITALEKLKTQSRGNDNMKEANKIAVVFRGSVYTKDWIQNITTNLTEIKIENASLIEGSVFGKIHINPSLAKDLKNATKGKPIKVHAGFLQYLFAGQSRDAMPKYNAIVNNLNILMKHAKFIHKSELTITGHSLGGALATLLSFFLACDRDILDGILPNRKYAVRKCISCISFAAPAVGNEGFQLAFALLEEKTRLRHLRITNGRDFVPLLPPLPEYRHTGVQLHLPGEDLFGIQRKAIIKDTGIINRSCLLPFLGCLLTTFPPVVLFPLYFLFCHIPLALICTSFWFIFSMLKAKDNTPIFVREKLLPLVAVLVPILVFYLPGLSNLLIENEPTWLHSLFYRWNVYINEWHGYIIGIIVLSQVIMFVRQPQHIYDSECKARDEYALGITECKARDEYALGITECKARDEYALGITHSLPFYYYNLQRAREGDRKHSGLSNSTEIWNEGNKRE